MTRIRRIQTRRTNIVADQAFAAMHMEVSIIEVHVSHGGASSSDGASCGAQVYWDKDGVWEEYRGDWWKKDASGQWPKYHERKQCGMVVAK